MTQLRRKRSFILLVAIALMMVWMIGVAWPSGNVVWAMLPSISQTIVTGTSFMLLIGAALFIPGLAATTVVVEKDRRSWDLLALTLLRPSGIIVGKLLSAVGMFLLYVIAVFPMLAVVFFLVGIDWLQMARSLTLVLMTCVTCGAVGIACSAMSRKTVTAMAASYFGMGLVMGLGSVISAALLGLWAWLFGADSLFVSVVPLIFAMSPFTVLMETTLGLGMFGSTGSTLFFYHLAYQAAITVVALLVAMWAVGRPAKLAVMPADDGDPRVPVKRRSMRERFRERRGRFRKPQPPIRDRRNPIFVRELQWGPAGSRRMYIGMLLLVTGMSLVLSYSVETINFSIAGAVTTALILHGILICCLVPTFLAGSFTRERELRSLDMLRMTLITPRQVVRGKFFAGLRLALGLSLISFMGNAPIFLQTWLLDGPMGALLAGHVSLFICALLSANLALFASVITKQTSTAVVTSFCFILFAYFGVSILSLLVYATARGRVGNDLFQFLYVFTSPVIGYFVTMGNAGRRFEFDFAWFANVVEFMFVILLVYYVTQTFYRRYRVRER